MKGTPTPTGHIRAAARNALFFSSNWISALISTFAVLLLIWGAVFFVDTVLWAASCAVWIPCSVDAAAYLLLYLLLSPLLPGLLGYYSDLYRASRGEGAARVPPNVIFSCYGHARTLVRAWVQMLIQLLLWASVPGAVFVSVSAAVAFTAGGSGYIMPLGAAAGLILSVVLLLTALYANARLAPALLLSVTLPELTLADSLRISLRMTRTYAASAVTGQLRLLLLSVLTLFFTAGIGYILYLLPLTVFTYISYASDAAVRAEF